MQYTQTRSAIHTALLTLLLVLPTSVTAANQALVDELKNQQTSLATLSAAARAAQYVLIGEDHGIAESAQFDATLFEDLAQHGFTALAIEDGPVVTEAIVHALHQPEPQRALVALDRNYPDSVAFYNWTENSRLLERVARAGGAKFAIWGIDQELMGAAKLVLEQMLRETIKPQARALITTLLAAERAAYAKAAASGKPAEHFMMTASDEDLRTLRSMLSGRALAMLDGLMASRDIYAKSMSSVLGQGQLSNVQRNLLMKRTLASHLSRAPGQKLLVQIGASHAYKGINNLGNREIGNYLAERAEGDGRQSLHILVLPASGNQARFAGTARPVMSAPVEIYTDGFEPLMEAARGKEGPTLFDLRALRARAHALAETDMQVERILDGYDFVVILTDVHAMQALH